MWDDEEKIEPKRAQDEPASPQRHLLGEHRRREVFPGSSQMEVASAVAEKPSPCAHAIISATGSTATSPMRWTRSGAEGVSSFDCPPSDQ